MKTVKYFDVLDKDITPEIYTLLFCGAFVCIEGNDKNYNIDPFEWVNEYEYDKDIFEKKFKARLDRGYQNCYHNQEKMKDLCENPISCKEALDNFIEWLKERNVAPHEHLIVAIWW